MPSLASISPLLKTCFLLGQSRSRGLVIFPRQTLSVGPRFGSRLVVASSSLSSDGHFTPNERQAAGSKNSILSNMIQEIEPLDISLIQKDVPMETINAMKRTISSMLGLLPSDQFHVIIEAFWGPLSKLLVSSIMTGYTLRNVEYRLCLERNTDIQDESSEKRDSGKVFLNGTSPMFRLQKDIVEESSISGMDTQDLGEMTPKVQEYILHLQSRLSSVKKELHELKRERSALQMQHFVGEEKNDLLDYLRSLQPEKVAELSEPTCPELQETVHSIVHGMLATLSPKIQTKASPLSDNTATINLTAADSDDCAELVENTSLNFQPLISVSRDYLARLLFWCMLLGHYIRGLEYRLELTQLLTIRACGEPTE